MWAECEFEAFRNYQKTWHGNEFLIPVVKPVRVSGVLTRSVTSDAIVGIPRRSPFKNIWHFYQFLHPL